MRPSILAGFATFVLAAAFYTASNLEQLDRLGLAPFMLGVSRSSFFLALAVGGCLYAIRCGGGPERIIGATILATVVADPILHLALSVRFVSVDPTHLIIDVARFGAFTLVALRANRFWPIWLAGLQMLALGAHLTREMELSIHPVVYAVMKAMWSYGMVALLVFATRNHQRLIAGGATRKSWNSFSPPAPNGAPPARR